MCVYVDVANVLCGGCCGGLYDLSFYVTSDDNIK